MEYRNDLGGVAVIVSYEYLSVPWVVVAPLDPISKKGQYGKGIPFHDYVAVRFPELAAALDRPPNGWTDSDIKRVLSEDAMTLKQFGRDLLEGDFDSLGDIRAHQKRRFERERRAFRRGILKQGDKPTAKHPSRQ
ncbi:MAG TPA: hypothetical protein VEZ90_08685 [Blastocatellia bacterium]|nr:hypothetical protein [Blastocatellia bacterium]